MPVGDEGITKNKGIRAPIRFSSVTGVLLPVMMNKVAGYERSRWPHLRVVHGSRIAFGVSWNVLVIVRFGHDSYVGPIGHVIVIDDVSDICFEREHSNCFGLGIIGGSARTAKPQAGNSHII